MTTVEEQIRIFSVFFIIGLFIGIIFDFFRCFRKVVKTSNIIVYLQDIFFLILIGIIFFRSVVLFNSGTLRFYLVLATSLGILVYFLTLSKGCVIIITVFLNVIKLLIKTIFKLIILPYYLVLKLFKRYRK